MVATMTRTTRRIQVRGRSIAPLELPPLAESLALPASASAAPFAPTISVTGFGDQSALAQIDASGVSGAPEFLAHAQTTTLPQPTGAAIMPSSAVVAWVGRQGGRLTRMSGP
jgi:hypothetical protein